MRRPYVVAVCRKIDYLRSSLATTYVAVLGCELCTTDWPDSPSSRRNRNFPKIPKFHILFMLSVSVNWIRTTVLELPLKLDDPLKVIGRCQRLKVNKKDTVGGAKRSDTC